MSSNQSKRPSQNTTAGKTTVKTTPAASVPGGFVIQHPLLWLALAALVVYFPSFFMGFTDLDDAIFIRDFHAYNEDVHNLVVSFQRGLFDAVKDPYYRPLFQDSMILNYQMNGDAIAGYHVVNVLLHITAVVLLYQLFRRLEVKELHAFILTLVFAVHPVLSQAVAWIPGRNDTILAVFVFAFLIQCINYANNGKIKHLLLSGLFLMLAYFTKETAIFAAPVAFVLLVFVLKKNWRNNNNLLQYGVWFGCFLLWYLARMAAAIQNSGIASAEGMSDFVHRIPVIIQYIGKVFLPFNLSVFPTQQDTVYYYGIAAVVLLGVIIYLHKQRNMNAILGGLAVFLLFLMPALLVPNKLNEQTFEHRLYLPIIGILLILPETVLLKNTLSDKNLFKAGVGVCCVLAAINFVHQKSFSDPRTFWTQAVETSPNSAYANMMLAARLDQKTEFQESCALFRKAYRLNPKEKYLNFYIGDMLQKKDSVQASESYLLAEKNSSGFYQCDFLLAHVALDRKDYMGAIGYLEKYLKTDVNNSSGNINLLLLYIQTQQTDKAKAQVRHMQQIGVEVTPQVLKQLGM